MIATLLLLLTSARAVSQADAQMVIDCLAAQDVACAEQVVDRAGLAEGDDAAGLALAASVAFSDADYPRALELLDRAIANGFDDTADRRGLYARTTYATAGWVEEARGRFRIRYRPGVDAVLVDDALDVLQRTDRFVTPLLGEPPPGNTVVEIYPDGRSFIAASSLYQEDVESTGVVAISKWTRLLVTSPRALGRGYEWQSTLSHEYLHLVVAHATNDEAPVWLQEAIAKYLDNRWETGGDAYTLTPRAEGQLAEALANDALVPFSEMHPSLAKIKVLAPDGTIDKAASAQRAALAYAQLASLMSYAFTSGGEDVLLRTLPVVAAGGDPREALASAVGNTTFASLLDDWEAWMRSKDLSGRDLSEMPTVLDGGEAADLDPVFARRRDLANYMRLGTLLAERSRYRAALVEYDKARDPEDPNAPLLATRVAEALVALDDRSQARARLEASVDDYPTFAPSWKALGEVSRAAGDADRARLAFERAVDLSPFLLDAQLALRDLYAERGRAEAVARQDAIARILRRGGTDDPGPPIHTVEGSYELPRADREGPATRELRFGLEDQSAPDFTVETLDGDPIALSELQGKVVIVDFWATWCGPCRAVMPELSAMATRWRDDGLVVLGISDEVESTVQRFVATQAKRGVTYEHTLALEGGGVRRDYGISSLPTLVVVDRSGVVRKVHVGAGDMAGVRAKVAELLGVEDVPDDDEAPGEDDEVLP